MKTCTKCGETKAPADYKHKSSGSRVCRRCLNKANQAYVKQRYATDPEFNFRRRMISNRVFAKRLGYATPDPNFTYDDYKRMLNAQGDTCLCGKPPTHIDHSHLTGKVRFLLCLRCNVALASFDDSPVLLRKFADALEAA